MSGAMLLADGGVLSRRDAYRQQLSLLEAQQVSLILMQQYRRVSALR
jgi:hypothetical protein